MKSVLQRDSGSEIRFNMLPFIMFDSTPISGHGNNFELCKRYRAPRARTQKRARKGGFWSLVLSF